VSLLVFTSCFAHNAPLSDEPWLFKNLQYIMPVVSVVFFSALLVWVWNIRLRQQVATRARALSSSEKTLRTILMASPVGIGLVRNNHLAWHNQAMTQMLGYQAQELTGINLGTLFIDESEFNKIASVIKEALQHEDNAVFETKWVRQDGSSFDCLLRYALLEYQDDSLSAVVIAEDITERKKAAAKVRQSEEWLRNIYDSSPVMMHSIDSAGMFCKVNKKWLETMGYTSAEVLGKRADFIMTPESAQRCLTTILPRFWQDGLAKNIPYQYVRKDGTIMDVLLDCAVAQDPSGKPLSLSVVRDLTDIKSTQEELRESEARFRNLLEYIPGVAIQGYSPDGIIRYWNKASEEIYGYTAAEALGKKQVDLIVPANLKAKFLRALAVGAKATRSGEFVPPGEHFLMHKDGSEIPIYAIHTVVCLKDRPPMMFCLEVDLSERKKLEIEQARVSRLESLGTLAGGIAHDFNNLLTTIVGNINLISLDSQLSEYNRNRLLKAENACQQAQGLSQRLLTFAKGGEPIKQVTSVKELLIETANLMLTGSKSRGKFSLAADLWLVDIDEGQINQVFSNLLINADQAMPAGGIIEIQAENVTLGTGEELMLSPEKVVNLSPGNYIKITVADQGLGITPDHHDKIFDPYFTTKPGCSGLGLSTTYSIIKNHQGYISFESEVGVGTRYYIYLPALESTASNQKKAVASPLTGQGKILIMDDDENVRDVLNKMLQKIGYEVVSACDGAEAVDLYQQAMDSKQPWAAVIFDLTIPGGMGGKEALERLVKIDPDIKAIVSSGYSDDQVMAEFKNYGFSGVIPKPYRLAELRAILHEVIN
jgi:PAS domain S-box-containing protein